MTSSAFSRWWRNLSDGVISTARGMRITLRTFLRKPVTVQYPDEKPDLGGRYRGIHYLEQDLCIYCDACAKACPVDCIEMDATRHGKELEWHAFTLDYNRCMLCELCVYPCPKDCIHQGEEYALVTEDREDMVRDLLTWKGLTEEQKQKVAEVEALKAQRAAGGGE
ncbi:MAG TPA: NADH-quinone oxidoreductase subunit I [Planctomycetes bacterium]|nr:NADH-quinone oxidoreductase subunit I [Planctomycetota bacterium]|tara:strand:+ start:409 stop:906 length:498 start_codon:yes stop_codon:yes gene_type:complete